MIDTVSLPPGVATIPPDPGSHLFRNRDAPAQSIVSGTARRENARTPVRNSWLRRDAASWS